MGYNILYTKNTKLCVKTYNTIDIHQVLKQIKEDVYAKINLHTLENVVTEVIKHRVLGKYNKANINLLIYIYYESKNIKKDLPRII